MPGGDMYEIHMEFIEWAGKYDTGSVNMRSMAKRFQVSWLVRWRK